MSRTLWGKLAVPALGIPALLLFAACGGSSGGGGGMQRTSFGLIKTIQLPNLPSGSSAAPLSGFDIAWFDKFNSTETVYVADSSNASVDEINTANNSFTGYINQGNFAGSKSAVDFDANGPDGVFTATSSAPGASFHELWVGDINTMASPGTPQIWAFDLTQTPPQTLFGGPIDVSCGSGGIVPQSGDPAVFPNVTCPGGAVERADEGAYDATDQVLVIAMPHPKPGSGAGQCGATTCGPYVTFVSVPPPGGTPKILGQVVFPNATNGIEQSVWDSNTDTFFVNLPEDHDLGDDAAGNPLGAVVRMKITSVSPFAVTVSSPASATDPYSTGINCEGNGLALNTMSRNLLIGCSVVPLFANSGYPPPFPMAGPPIPGYSIIMGADTGTIAAAPETGGSDEVWYNPGDDTYYLAELFHGALPVPFAQNAALGIIDGSSNAVLGNVATTFPAHDVTADSVNNEVVQAMPPNDLSFDNSANLDPDDDFSCTKGCYVVWGSVADEGGE